MEMHVDRQSVYLQYLQQPPQAELTVDLEVFVLPVLNGDHVERCPVREHHPSWFLGNRRSSRSSGEQTKHGDVLISLLGDLSSVRSRRKTEAVVMHLFKSRL